MSSLFLRAKDAFRRLFQRRTTRRNEPPGGASSLPGPPPIQKGSPHVSQPKTQASVVTQANSQDAQDIKAVQQVYDDLELFGRDRGFSDDMGAVMDKMRRVSSSNVYGYYFELEQGVKHSPTVSNIKFGQRLANQKSASGNRSGILYVTFLAEGPGNTRTDAPGATYAYFDVPMVKYGEFTHASDSSAGKAVWDYLRVRGSSWEHQHRYRLIQTSGDYIPRKATKSGFKTRQLAPTGQPKIPNSVWSAISRLSNSDDPKIRNYAGEMKRYLLAKNQFRRSTLPPRSFVSRGTPNRGTPNRG